MRLAFTLSTYRLFDFIHLGIKQLRALRPDAPILLSDDFSPESVFIKQLAKEQNVEYVGSDKRRGHFAGDMQSLVSAIMFADVVEADLAIKISQRFMLRLPEAIEVIERAFEDPSIAMAIPGQPKGTMGGKASKGFSEFAVLSDIVCVRPSQFPASRMLEIYRRRIVEEKVPWKTFIEAAVHEAHMKLGAQSKLLPELTDHGDQANPIYLRRYQNTEAQYVALANKHGITGRFPLAEWGLIQGKGYMAKPVVV